MTQAELEKILSTVNNFYQNSFNQLVIVVVGLVAFIGALVPTLIAIFQNRTLRRENEVLKLELRNLIDQQVIHAKNQIHKELETEISENRERLNKDLIEFREQIEKIEAKSSARTYHLQATSMGRDHIRTVISAANAVIGYAKGGDEFNMKRAYSIFEKSIPFIDRAQIDLEPVFDESINELLAEIGKINQNGRYTDWIRQTELQIKAAKGRQAQPS